LCGAEVFLVKGPESQRKKEKICNDWLETWTENLGSTAMQRQEAELSQETWVLIPGAGPAGSTMLRLGLFPNQL